MKDTIIREILAEMKDNLDCKQNELLNNILIVKFNSLKITREEQSLVKYEMTKSQQIYQMFFITKKIQGLTERSLGYYRTVLDQALKVINKPVEKITSDDIKYYLACYQIERKVSQTTVDNVRRVLNSFFQFMEDEEYIQRSPTRKIKKVKQEVIIKKPFTELELEQLRIKATSPNEKAIVEFLFSTGVRITELVELNIKDIDFRERNCVVYGKGRKERYVYLNAKTMLNLQMYINTRTDKNSALFVSTKSPHNRLTVAGVQSMLRKLGAKADIENVHPHRFRRTAATIAHSRGMKLEDIQKMLGHSDVKTTMIYVAMNNSSVKLAHDKFMN